jgi:hypothetical protein
VTSQVSHPYKSTDFTQALNILIFVSFRNNLDSHTFLSLEKHKSHNTDQLSTHIYDHTGIL